MASTNVFVFYGQDACNHFESVLSRWAEHVFSHNDWNRFRFYLVGTELPKMNTEKFSHLIAHQRLPFFLMDESCPSARDIESDISECVEDGRVIVHVICSSGNKAMPYDWLIDFLDVVQKNTIWQTDVVLYMLANRQGYKKEKKDLVRFLQQTTSATVLLGDYDINGASVPPVKRWMSIMMAVPMMASGKLPLARTSLYSFGYSTLNADNQELEIIRRAKASEIMSRAFNEALSEEAARRMLLPEDANDFRTWLQKKAKDKVNALLQQKNVNSNVRILSRFDTDEGNVIPVKAATGRVCKFFDLSLTEGESLKQLCDEFVDSEIASVKTRLMYTPESCAFPETVFDGIISELQRVANEPINIHSQEYPRLPLIRSKGKMKEYADNCWDSVFKSARTYAEDSLRVSLAKYLASAYADLKHFILLVKQDDTVMDDERRFGGGIDTYLNLYRNELQNDWSLSSLQDKYPHYVREIDAENFALTNIAEGYTERLFYNENGMLVEESWREYIRECADRIANLMPERFKGRNFIKIISAEFDDPDERKLFFDTYLASGRRMFNTTRNADAAELDRYLVDYRFDDQWFKGKDKVMGKTDNAEHLSVFRLGQNIDAETLLAEYYINSEPDPENGQRTDNGEDYESHGGTNLLSVTDHPVNGSLVNRALQDKDKADPDEDDTQGLKLVIRPDHNYYLTWNMNVHDEHVYITIRKNGQKIGKTAIVEVRQFKNEHNRWNVSDKVLQGKPMPMGEIEVMLNDSQGNELVHAKMKGAREWVIYEFDSAYRRLRLEISPNAAELFMLEDSDQNGHSICYPVWLSGNQGSFSGLMLSTNATISCRPGCDVEIVLS